MKWLPSLRILLLFALLLPLYYCGGGGDNPPNTPQSVSLAPGAVAKISTSNSQASVILGIPTQQEAYLQVVHTAVPLPGTQPFTLRSSAPSLKLVVRRTDELIYPLQDARLLFEQNLRAEERRIVSEGFLPVEPDTAVLFDLLDVAVGDQQTFFIRNPQTDQFVERTATARAVGVHSVFFVDDTNVSILPDQIQQMFADFEAIIYPRDVQLFGEESDVNGDGRITILITSLLNSSGIVGFFRPLDLFPRDASNPTSNEQEILYVASPSPTLPLGLIQATIAHEFQHLINLNQKVLQPLNRGVANPPLEDVWLNEALSHLAEDLTGFSENGDDLVDIIRSYLDQVALFSLTEGIDTLPRRGAGYLFLRYLFEQAGGVTYSQTDPAILTDNGGITFLRQLESSTAIGIENIRTALRTVPNPFQQAPDPFREAFANWVVALAIDGTGLNSNLRFNYQPPEFDQITEQLRGIDLRGTREGRGGLVTLQGPRVQSFNNQQGILQGTGVAYVLFQASPGGEGTTTITLGGNAESQLQLTVIRTQ